MQKLEIHTWKDKVFVEGARTAYDLGALLTAYLNYDGEELLGLCDDLRSVQNKVEFPYDDPYTDGYDRYVQRAQNYMSDIDEIIAELPPYRDMPPHPAEQRLFALLNQYSYLFESDFVGNQDNMYEADDGEEGLFQLGEHSFMAGENGRIELIHFVPDVNGYEKQDGFELYEKTKALVEEYVEWACEVLRVRRVYGKLLDDYIHITSSMPNEYELAQRVEKFLHDHPVALQSYNAMTRSAGMNVRYTTVQDEQGRTVIDRVTEYRSIGDYLYMELFNCIQSGQLPKKCKSCGQYFMMRKGYYTEYCERIAPGETEKTCREVGARKTFDEKVRNDPVWLAHQRAYKTHYARMMKKKMTKAEFFAWTDMALTLRERAAKGELPFDEYEKKLKL